MGSCLTIFLAKKVKISWVVGFRFHSTALETHGIKIIKATSSKRIKLSQLFRVVSDKILQKDCTNNLLFLVFSPFQCFNPSNKPNLTAHYLNISNLRQRGTRFFFFFM